jgi:hypothetical protein
VKGMSEPYRLKYSLPTQEINKKEEDGTANGPIEHTNTINTTETTTVFQTAAQEMSAAAPQMEIDVPPAVFADSSPEEYSSILKYLGKPHQLADGKFNSGDNVATFPYWPMPYYGINNELLLSKFRGYLGFRATIVVTIHFNAERFQQGRYMLCAIPCGGSYWNSKTEEHANAHYASLTTRTQLPRVEFDLNTETSATIRLPFNSAVDYYPFNEFDSLNKAGRCWYVLRMSPYSPLNTVDGALEAKWAVFTHFEDVELIGQNYALLNPVLEAQSAMTTVRKKKGRISDSQKEAESANIGPISAVTTKVAKAAKILEVVPFIGTYMSPLGWAANIATSVAQVFGWSKPVMMNPVTRVRETNAAYSTNVDGADASFTLTAYSTNEVARFPGMSPTSKDEMSLAYIAGVPAYVKNFLIDTSFAEDFPLAFFEASPFTIQGVAAPKTILNASGVPITYYTPAEFVASQFLYWRGTICFRFKFVKTEFHAGRIAIAFQPYSTNAQGISVLNENGPYVYRDIINIGDYLEYTFKVPYIAEQPYKSCDLSKPFWERSFGRISVRVVDPLIAPSSASPSINVLVESYMEEDAEFAVPNTLLALPSDITPVITLELEPQSALGGMKEHKPSILPSTVCVGERIMSFRSLLKRAQPLVRHDEGYTAPTTDGYLAPYGYSKLILDGLPSTAFYADNYALFAQMYCYSRGGVRVKTSMDNGARSMTLLGDVSQTLTTLSTNSTAAGWFPRSLGYAKLRYPYVQGGVNSAPPVLEVQTGQYLPIKARVNHEHSISVSYPFVTSGAVQSNSVIWYSGRSDVALTPQPLTDPTVLYRAGADDCDFSFFISVPPMYVGVELPIDTV